MASVEERLNEAESEAASVGPKKGPPPVVPGTTASVETGGGHVVVQQRWVVEIYFDVGTAADTSGVQQGIRSVEGLREEW
jgi:hypothetical protein